MTQLGRVYRGQMVDMLARNEKLRRRAVRMLRALTRASTEQAAAALTQAAGGSNGGAHRGRPGRGRGGALLSRSDGDLRRAERPFGPR